MRPPDSPPVVTAPGADLEEPETPERAKARRREAFCARGPRYARHVWLLDADPFAVACELVDILARLDAFAEAHRALEAQVSYLKARAER